MTAAATCAYLHIEESAILAAYQQSEKHGLEFGRLCHAYGEKYGAQGSANSGLAQFLRKSNIKEGKAYYWIAAYKASIGQGVPCPSCSETFPSKTQMKKHQHRVHPEPARVYPSVPHTVTPVTPVTPVTAETRKEAFRSKLLAECPLPSTLVHKHGRYGSDYCKMDDTPHTWVLEVLKELGVVELPTGKDGAMQLHLPVVEPTPAPAPFDFTVEDSPAILNALAVLPPETQKETEQMEPAKESDTVILRRLFDGTSLNLRPATARSGISSVAGKYDLCGLTAKQVRGIARVIRG